MKIVATPLADRVVILQDSAEEVTKSGIIIPNTAKEKPKQGTVVSVGKGTKEEPLTVKPGDKVMFGQYSGTQVSMNNEEYLIMRESEIFAIITEES